MGDDCTSNYKKDTILLNGRWNERAMQTLKSSGVQEKNRINNNKMIKMHPRFIRYVFPYSIDLIFASLPNK